MKVDLVNFFHAGDVILSRAIIERLRPLLVDRVRLHLRCQPQYAYLWQDLHLPVRTGPCSEEDVQPINLWFGYQQDLLGVTGLTHATQVTSYNRQAGLLGLPKLEDEVPMPPPVHLPAMGVADAERGGVLVENGPVLSGQPTAEVNTWLVPLAKEFPRIKFYCASKPADIPNLVDVSKRNLIQLSALSNYCDAMVARLSGVFVSTLTAHNRGRLPRYVVGQPIGCPIWDEGDVRYLESVDELRRCLKERFG